MAESPVPKEGGDSVATPQGSNQEPGTQRVGDELSHDVETQPQIAEPKIQPVQMKRQRRDRLIQLSQRYVPVIALVVAILHFLFPGGWQPWGNPTTSLLGTSNQVEPPVLPRPGESDDVDDKAPPQTDADSTDRAPEQGGPVVEESLIDTTIAQAIAFQRQGKSQEAIQLWRAIAVMSEGQDDDLAARAWSYSAFLNQAEDRQQAIDDYGKAIALNPNFAEAYTNRGAARNNLGRNEEAIDDFNKAIELDPDADAAYTNRGNATTDLGRPEEAIDDFNEALELNPDSYYAYLGRGNAKNVLKRHEQAIDDFNEALELNPDYVNAHVGRGIAKYHLGRREEAWADFAKAIELKPELEQRLSVFQ